MEPIYVVLPLLAGGVGWLTNRLAIQFLFRPRDPVRILGLRFQGLIPRRKADLATTISETVAATILPADVIGREIRKLDVSGYTDDLADRLVNEVLMNRIQKIPFVSNLLSSTTVDQIRSWVERELAREAERMLERVGHDAGKNLDLTGAMRERIESFDDSVLEAVVRKVAHREFRAIEWWGFLIGFLVGLVQLGLVLVL